MALMWFVVGLITGLSVFAFVELHNRFNLNWLGWSGLILGEFLILFCIAWSTASIFEGVPRAASMGLLMFGGAGLVTLILTWRLVVQKAARAGG
jgi:hypothetical protein